MLLLFSGFISRILVSDFLLNRVIENTRQSLDIIIQSIDSVLNDVETGALRVASDPVVQGILIKEPEKELTEGLDQYFLVKSILDKILYIRNYIDSISVYRLDGSPVGSGYINYGKASEKKRLSAVFVRMVMEAQGRNLWTDPGSLMYTLEQPVASGPVMYRTVRQANLGRVIGIVEVNMNRNIFSRLYSHLDYGKTGRFIVVNRKGILIFPESYDYSLYSEFFRNRYLDLVTDQNNPKGRIATFGKEQFVVISSHLERLGWLIIGMIPMNELQVYSKNLSLSIYAIGLFCILLEILFAIWISRSISHPIRSLSDCMLEAAQGDMLIRMPSNRRDEIGILAQSFNEMLERISFLMEQVYNEQKKERELELIALQSQINPHFLYNSLESICALSKLNRNEDAYTLGKALAMFYRGVLSRGKPFVTIKEEIDTLIHYFTIQETRYRGKFSYRICVGKELYDKRIVKLTLQPLVENAIYHGLKNVRRVGSIWILGKVESQDRIVLTVVDNGIGMSREQIEEVLSNGKRGDIGPGYGLRNVDQRIKLSFGDAYGLKIESRPGYYTKVHVLIPCISQE